MLFYLSHWDVVGDGGLCDILIDSDVYAYASIDQMLSRKQYNRAVRGLIYVYEAMLKYLGLMVSYFKWCEQNTICRKLRCVDFCVSVGNNMDIREEILQLNKSIVDTLIPLLNIFIEEGCTKSRHSNTGMHISMLFIVFWVVYIHAERVGDWKNICIAGLRCCHTYLPLITITIQDGFPFIF